MIFFLFSSGVASRRRRRRIWKKEKKKINHSYVAVLREREKDISTNVFVKSAHRATNRKWENDETKTNEKKTPCVQHIHLCLFARTNERTKHLRARRAIEIDTVSNEQIAGVLLTS